MGKTIVDPVLALSTDLFDGEDEELTAEGKKEREEAMEDWLAWGGLSVPSSSRGGGRSKGRRREGYLSGVMWMMRVEVFCWY